MRAVIQRVSKGSVKVEDKICGEIGQGLLVLLGVGKQDTAQEASLLADKICNLRVFEDDNGLMNHSLLETGGEMLVVSQFTLFGDCRKGRRPSYSAAAPPEKAKQLYLNFVEEIKKRGVTTATGEFQAMMDVTLINNGPVTLLIDTEKTF
ncbi:MAG: D-aminoacyl-tRNA deacylase [Desulfobulbaceae bacterium]|nr:D-aminoacyl-tRNA deacylase [Desulfobulbaceae bacterium]HIJ79950.1 D-tyrosyl-tRNA(Tyr) deacylase [Deltaproteobacteria bacterium]